MKIISICAAAPGWVAVYKDDDGGTLRSPIAAWVVCQDEGVYFVDGIDPEGAGWDGSPCSLVGNFKEFLYEPDRSRKE